MLYRQALLIFAFQVTHVFTARFLFKEPNYRRYRTPIIEITPEKIDWSCGELSWDITDDDNNSTIVVTNPSKPVRPDSSVSV
jgi:hypothetical protein